MESIRQSIIDWSSSLEAMPQYIFNFARKALIQQLPTASNLHRWKKIASPMCNLCSSDKVQTNKHALNNCDKALERYTERHDNVLSLLAKLDLISEIHGPWTVGRPAFWKVAINCPSVSANLSSRYRRHWTFQDMCTGVDNMPWNQPG